MRRAKAYISNSTFFKGAVIFSLFMLLLIGAVSFYQLESVNRIQKLLLQSRNRQLEMERLFSAIKDAERMQRGYIITNEQKFIRCYNKSKAEIYNSLVRLKGLTGQEPAGSYNYDTLSTYIQTRIALMDASLPMVKGPSASPELRQQMKKGAVVMRKIENNIRAINRQEEAILHKHENLHRSHNRYLPYITALLVVFSLSIFLISFYKISRDTRRIKKMNQDLKMVNKSFEYAEQMSSIGHWKRNLNTFEIIPSDNMYRLFGLRPGQMPYNEETILSFVHPEDREKLINEFKKIREEHTEPNVTYRIVRADGKIRYFNTRAKKFTINGIPVMLGATCDITEQITNRIFIEEKNKELEQMVQEMESFNYVASHDLQEPLRKIQIFISRIIEDESGSLSENAQNYFKRIRASAERMELLISDLLLYSQAGREEHVFETADLNVLLQEALQELFNEIELKDAIITASGLPSVSVIPFQIRQLFINLIGNALKYSGNKKPEIKISCAEVPGAALPKLNHKTTYYEIAVADNGIGFGQEYAEKIFVLFQRLHNKSEYSGTGIGLAICKKITENHKGLITAESSIGNGSIFRFYLPK